MSDWTTLSVRKFYINSNFLNDDFPSLTLNVNLLTLTRALHGTKTFIEIIKSCSSLVESESDWVNLLSWLSSCGSMFWYDGPGSSSSWLRSCCWYRRRRASLLFLAKLSLSPLDLVMVLWDNRMNWKMQVLFLFFRFYLGTKRGEKSGLFIYFIFIYFYFLFIFFCCFIFIFYFFLFYFLFIYFSFFFIYLFNFFKLFILYFYLFFCFYLFQINVIFFWQCLLWWVLKHHNSCSMNRLWCR